MWWACSGCTAWIPSSPQDSEAVPLALWNRNFRTPLSIFLMYICVQLFPLISTAFSFHQPHAATGMIVLVLRFLTNLCKGVSLLSWDMFVHSAISSCTPLHSAQSRAPGTRRGETGSPDLTDLSLCDLGIFQPSAPCLDVCFLPVFTSASSPAYLVLPLFTPSIWSGFIRLPAVQCHLHFFVHCPTLLCSLSFAVFSFQLRQILAWDLGRWPHEPTEMHLHIKSVLFRLYKLEHVLLIDACY